MHMVLWKYNDEIAIIKIIEIGSVIEHHQKKMQIKQNGSLPTLILTHWSVLA